jgi:hypothetical protein
METPVIKPMSYPDDEDDGFVLSVPISATHPKPTTHYEPLPMHTHKRMREYEGNGAASAHVHQVTLIKDVLSTNAFRLLIARAFTGANHISQ